MTKMTRSTTAALFSLGLAVLMSGCEKGPVEKLGEKIDNGVQNTKDAARDVKDKITTPTR
jgi:hypothetical protein